MATPLKNYLQVLDQRADEAKRLAPLLEIAQNELSGLTSEYPEGGRPAAIIAARAVSFAHDLVVGETFENHLEVVDQFIKENTE